MTAVKYAGANGAKSLWEIKCDCGTVKLMAASEFRKGKIKSCGCMQKKLVGLANTTHGKSQHPLYWVWRSMKARCYNPNHEAYHNYGGRGITVCDAWLESFENFWEDMAWEYEPGDEIDRRNNEKGYEPNNCWFVSSQKNMRNTRANRVIDTPKGQMLICEAAEISGIGATTITYRLAQNCPTERLFDKPNFQNRFST